MPPSDNTPDFDSMTPEELMAWMETLAERQGAVEGFTTEKRMEIGEVDPEAAQDTGPGYIPYGMSEEEWARRVEKEEAEKQARLAERAQRLAAAQPTPQAQAEEPPPEPAQPAPATAGTPDFDSMTPEELMAWMETLAERQGAVEGFTTEKRMEIGEVDPEAAQDTGPGYIPYGMSEEEWARRVEKEEAEKQARLAERAQRLAAAQPTPEPEEEPAPDLAAELEFPDEEEEEAAPVGLDWLESLAADQTGGFPDMDLSGLGEEIASLDLSGFDEAVADVANPMDWLENIASEQGVGDEVPGQQVEERQPVEQMSFDDALPADEDEVDPIEWLESLAARQPNPPDAEEFITDASLDIPLPDELDETQAPGYQDYEYEASHVTDSVDLPDFVSGLDDMDVVDSDDPAAWLDSLASSQHHDAAQMPMPSSFDDMMDFDEDEDGDFVDENVLDKLNQGISNPEDMENWMSALLERGATRPDAPPDYIEDEDEDEAVAIEAQIPDWLIEQVGQPPDLSVEAVSPVEEILEDEDEAVELPAGLEDLGGPVDEESIPDWLKEGLVEDEGQTPEDIFAGIEEDDEAVEVDNEVLLSEMAPGPDLQIDTSDPWVEAFELERTQQGVPEWYTQALEDTEGMPAAAESAAAQPAQAAARLQAANLPDETDLDYGEPEAVPAWMREEVTGAEAVPAADTSWLDDLEGADEELAISDEDIPDWLREQMEADSGEYEPVVAAVTGGEAWLEDAEIDKTDTVPDWLLETVDEDEEQEVIGEGDTIEVTPEPAQPAAPVAISPAPTPPPTINVSETLESARSKIKANELEGALYEYEAVIRANAEIQTVISDLSDLVTREPYKSTAAVFRVLGDGLMRNGQLQQALDTYRKALNLL